MTGIRGAEAYLYALLVRAQEELRAARTAGDEVRIRKAKKRIRALRFRLFIANLL